MHDTNSDPEKTLLHLEQAQRMLKSQHWPACNRETKVLTQRPMGRFDGFRPEILPDFPDDGTSSKGWLEWVDELLDNISVESQHLTIFVSSLKTTAGRTLFPTRVTSATLITAIYDKIEGEIDPSQYIPKKILKKIDNIDIAEGLAELMAFGYDKIDAKGRYIDPWTDKVLDYADFNIVVPKSGKTKVKGGKER